MSSRFFRSDGSSSTSSSDSESVTDSDVASTDEETKTMSNEAIGASSVERPSVGLNFNHQEWLLHALLEERCLNEARGSHQHGSSNIHRSDSLEIKAQAKAKYQRMCAQMASYNLISSGLETDNHAITRQKYRDGLDLLSQHRSATAVPPRLRRLLTDPETSGSHPSDVGEVPVGETDRQLLPFPLRRLLIDADNHVDVHSKQLSPTLGLSGGRYHNEFEEKGLLGRGGYGIVYRVRHRVDNQIYALKKVPISSSSIRRLHGRGDSGLDDLLNEVRTLARLDHPNIVRYYHCWVEWVDVPRSSGLLFDRSEGEAVMGAEDHSESDSCRRVVTESDTDETSIAFDRSDQLSARQISRKTSNTQHLIERYSEQSATTSRGYISSDRTVETISRSLDPSVSIESAAGGPQFTEPTLALHLQMSLHPMTLADFISPTSSSSHDNGVQPLAHCFHLEPSVSIMLLIVDGIEYLHDEGIVHRDLKPGNIFMGLKRNPRSTRGSVDLLLCNDCRSHHNINPIRLEVKIGDFGLATVVNLDAEADAEAVGTKIYRPLTAKARSMSLDIYALGIILFELLWKFDTRSERLHDIQRLKQGRFPHGFAESLNTTRAKEVVTCITAMLSLNGDGVSIHRIRQMLLSMQS